MWNRDYRGRDPGDRARELADRAGDAVRRGIHRLRGDADDAYRAQGWGRYHREDYWGRDRFGAARPRFAPGQDERGLTWRGLPGSDLRGGPRDPGRRYGGMARGEPGWGSVHYDRDFGYGAYGAIRDRGFEAFPHETGGARPRYRGIRRYDRDMRAPRYSDLADQTWSPPMRRWSGQGRTPSGYEMDWRDRADRVNGMTPGWSGEPDRGFREYRGYARGAGDEPYYGRDDFRGREEFRRRESAGYDADFEGDWF